MAERFILVHGGFHSGACWAPFEPRLRALGHTTEAMDLPIDVAGVGADGYADTVAEAMGKGPAPWLVGHSMGGTVVPRVALKTDVAGIILLCPGLPPRNQAEHEENLGAFTPGLGEEFEMDANGFAHIPPEVARRVMYHDAPPAIADAVTAHLRPQWAAAMNFTYQPMERFPDVPIHVIYARDDRILPFDINVAMARRRFGVEPIAIDGGHSPFVSRPEELARLFDRLVSCQA